jgi:hypothetical protein
VNVYKTQQKMSVWERWSEFCHLCDQQLVKIADKYKALASYPRIRLHDLPSDSSFVSFLVMMKYDTWPANKIVKKHRM